MAGNKNVVAGEDAGLISTLGSPVARMAPAPINNVRLRDGSFWKRWMDANVANGIPALFDKLEENGVLDNFRRLYLKKKIERRGPYFTDSDLYKWMEAAAIAFGYTGDATIGKMLDTAIDVVVKAQCKDGYINTFFTGDLADQRFRNLGDEHELYCAGHLFQAAVAHFRATGKRNLLDCALRFADYLVETFGPGKIEQFDGHPEIEMSLVELYRTTGSRKYLDLAGFFLRRQSFGSQGQISGHAVRAAYLVAGAADFYAETGDVQARTAAESLWEDMATGRVYITGGLGARHAGEAIGERYELPNESAYAETCAAIANGMWNFRMLVNSGDSRYADMLEKAFYNGFLSGVSLDTTHWFYVNPLANYRAHQREDWFGCTCCPSNVVRTLAAIPGYFYSVSNDGLWVHLYDDSTLDWKLADGTPVHLDTHTFYPWDGSVTISVEPEKTSEFTLHLRIPGWCSRAKIKVNGEQIDKIHPGRYLNIHRVWSAGDKVRISFKMPVQLMASDTRVRSNLGSVAMMRGPMVFCVESVDNPKINLRDLEIAQDPKVETDYDADMLEGVVTINAKGYVPATDSRGPLYRPVDSEDMPQMEKVRFNAIPYYSWANRGVSDMVVWMPYRKK